MDIYIVQLGHLGDPHLHYAPNPYDIPREEVPSALIAHYRHLHPAFDGPIIVSVRRVAPFPNLAEQR